jgi:hypothetical protein
MYRNECCGQIDQRDDGYDTHYYGLSLRLNGEVKHHSVHLLGPTLFSLLQSPVLAFKQTRNIGKRLQTE